MAQCKNKAKSTQKRCRRRAVKGYKVCQVHGAGSPLQGRPGGRPPTKGKFYRYLPKDLGEKVIEASKDPDLLSLRNEIKLLDARLMQLIERVEEGGATTNWTDINTAWKTLQRSQGDPDATAAAIQSIQDIIARGLHDSMIWVDIRAVISDRGKLVRVEARRLVDMRQTITSERALALVLAMADIVMGELTEYREDGKVVDDVLQKKIAYQIRLLVNVNPD